MPTQLSALPDTPTDRRSRVAAVLLGLAPGVIVVELIALALVRAPHSVLDHMVSDLAAVSCASVEYPYGPVEVCSPAGVALNIAFIASGVLLIVGAILLPRRWRPGKLGAWAVAMWVVAGLSSIGAGLVPLDVDLDLHALVALPAIAAQPIALVPCRAWRCKPRPRVSRPGGSWPACWGWSARSASSCSSTARDGAEPWSAWRSGRR